MKREDLPRISCDDANHIGTIHQSPNEVLVLKSFDLKVYHNLHGAFGLRIKTDRDVDMLIALSPPAANLLMHDLRHELDCYLHHDSTRNGHNGERNK